METRLKERLTGAAILVALIVLVVPELFHGQHQDVASNTSSSGEGPPVRSYTIDLSNGSARTAPLQSTESSGESAAGTHPPAAELPARQPCSRRRYRRRPLRLRRPCLRPDLSRPR